MHTRRTVLAAIAGAASTAVTLSACSQGKPQSIRRDATVGIAMPTRSSERWITDGENLVRNLKGKGYKTRLVYGDDNPDQQATQIRQLTSQRVDVMVIAAIDSKGLDAPLQKAKSAGIPIISYDRLILGTNNVDYYASFDNKQVGLLQARYIIDKLGLENGKGPFNIELFAGSEDDNNTKLFFNGAMELLQPYLDSDKLTVRSGQTELRQITTVRWDGVAAHKRMVEILDKSYGGRRVDAILSPYDGISIGALRALKESGYGSSGKALPIITGQDAELASIKSIIAGEQSQTVYKDLRKLAVVAADMVNSVLLGISPSINDFNSYNNGIKNVPANLLQPISVDKSNYKSVLIGGGFYSAAELK
ncbi:multiple monosaccharide ABC transporter substrate-binding protein [Streptomyces sp. NPDC095817]|uniref:multiple monosaccharide ABC transporter substrate-binding protein n=1 Tax=Streptomyces sp. NPDC095817 TaxID=3155082 RepID=UPI003323FB79